MRPYFTCSPREHGNLKTQKQVLQAQLTGDQCFKETQAAGRSLRAFWPRHTPGQAKLGKWGGNVTAAGTRQNRSHPLSKVCSAQVTLAAALKGKECVSCRVGHCLDACLFLGWVEGKLLLWSPWRPFVITKGKVTTGTGLKDHSTPTPSLRGLHRHSWH